MIFVVWFDAEIKWIFILRKNLELKSKDFANKFFFMFKVTLNISQKLYISWSVSLTYICQFLFTNGHTLVLLFMLRRFACGKNVELFSEVPGWDIVYSETFCVPTSLKFPAYRPDHKTNASFLIISHPTFHRYCYFHGATVLTCQGLVITQTPQSQANT